MHFLCQKNDKANEKTDFKLNGKHTHHPIKIRNLCGKKPFTVNIKNYFVNMDIFLLYQPFND